MDVTRIIILIIAAQAAILFQTGCVAQKSAPVFTKDGETYGTVRGSFRNRWWNYFERGLSYQDGGYYDEAINDFNMAIQKRPEDQRMARTYGMHFIDYFPHRELGVTGYLKGDLELSKKELQLSLRQYPTAKARFYLDRVRKKMIEQVGRAVAPPKLTLDFEQDEIWTREDEVLVAGTVEDENYISEITINNTPYFLEGSQKKVSFSESLNLSQGSHTVEVMAKNLFGERTNRTILIHVDREGPVLTLENIEYNKARQDPHLNISGSLYDPAGVAGLTINGRSVNIKPGEEVFFSENFSSEKESLEVVAEDRLGNSTTTRFSMRQANTQQKPILLASAGLELKNLIPASFFGSKDSEQPHIDLKGLTASQTVFLDKIYFEIEVSDQSNIIDVTINTISKNRRPGRRIILGHLADLEEGINHFIIEATDEHDNKGVLKFSVTRKVPAAFQLTERMSLTVLPFEQKGTVSEASLSVQDNLIDFLVDRNRFRVIERERIQDILQELKLSNTDLIDRSTALKLGKLIAAQAIIVGSIIETSYGIEVVARMVDTESSEIIAVEDVYDEDRELPSLMTLAEGMAVKFHHDFPLLDGLIIKQKGDAIFTDIGAEKLKRLRRLIIFRDGETMQNPKTGEILGSDNIIIGRARVTQIMPEFSKAELVEGDAASIMVMDRVISE